MSFANRLHMNIVLPVGAIDKTIFDNILLIYCYQIVFDRVWR